MEKYEKNNNSNVLVLIIFSRQSTPVNTSQPFFRKDDVP
jgi:hypothetical protein